MLIVAAIKNTYKSDALWRILLDESVARSGPFDGACLICAKALIRTSGGGELVRIISDVDGGQTEHYGARIAGGIYDFSGHHASPAAWIRGFEKQEGTGRNLSFAVGHDAESETPDDPSAEKKVASLLVEERARLVHDVSVKFWKRIPLADREEMIKQAGGFAVEDFHQHPVKLQEPGQAEGLPSGVAVVSSGSHEGRVVDVGPDFVIQHVGRGVNVAHAREEFKDAPVVGLPLRVAYRDGGIVVSGVGERGRKSVGR